jgi:hypothetical protein
LNKKKIKKLFLTIFVKEKNLLNCLKKETSVFKDLLKFKIDLNFFLFLFLLVQKLISKIFFQIKNLV